FCCTKCGHKENADINAAKYKRQGIVSDRGREGCLDTESPCNSMNYWWENVKEKYIEAKLQYLHYLDMDYSDRYPNIDPDTEGYVEVGPYTIKRGETFNQLMIAADLMTGYITHCVMNEIDHDEYMCFFEDDHTIEDTWHPQFEFSFEFMAMPKLELLKEKHPSLLKI
ncbi:MAG: hypothetical protein ACI3ZY_05930, partial [Parabacteroides sp.]